MTVLAKSFVFLQRDLRQEMSYRFAFVIRYFGIAAQMAMFFFIAKIFGSAASPYLSRYGGGYFGFVILGLAVSRYMGVAIHGIPGTIRNAQLTGTLEALLGTRTSLAMILFGSSLYPFLQATLELCFYIVAGWLAFGLRIHLAGLVPALLILLATILAFAGVGIYMASFVAVFKRGNPLLWIFSQMSFLLGGVFFPVNVLPRWLRQLADFIPLTHALEGMRLALIGHGAPGEVARSLLLTSLFAAALLPTSLIVFSYAVKRAKMRGTLAQY